MRNREGEVLAPTAETVDEFRTELEVCVRRAPDPAKAIRSYIDAHKRMLLRSGDDARHARIAKAQLTGCLYVLRGLRAEGLA